MYRLVDAPLCILEHIAVIQRVQKLNYNGAENSYGYFSGIDFKGIGIVLSCFGKENPHCKVNPELIQLGCKNGNDYSPQALVPAL